MGNLTAMPTNEYIELWKTIYKGKADWLDYSYPTLTGRINKRTRKAFKGAKMVCSELVSLMYSEEPEVTVSDDLQDILKRSGWYKNIKQFTEYCSALGGGAFKLYTRDSQLYIDYVPADRFIPVSWDSSGIYEADFLDIRVHNKKEYLRVEKHRKTLTGYNIKQEFYFCGVGKNNKMLAPATPFSLGLEIDGNELLNGVDIATTKPLFSYVGLPCANNIDIESPTGISFFHNSIDTLEGLDIAFDALQSEITLGRKRIIVPASAVRKVTDNEGNQVQYFDPSDEAFVAFEANDNEDLKITDNTVELRVDELRQAIQTYLDILSVQVGFSSGYLTFDGQSGTKTATEIISENSKTHKTVINIENSVRDSILGIFESIEAISSIYGLKIGDYDYIFQDNIHQDKDSITAYWTGRLNSNTITLEEFLQKVDGLSEAEAKTKAEAIRVKSATGNVDNIFNVEV